MSTSLRSPRYQHLRELLISARRAAGLTQHEVAERLGRPQSFVAKYEGGERRLDVIEFIAVAEESGLIFDLDRWVIEAVVRQMSSWPRITSCPSRTTICEGAPMCWAMGRMISGANGNCQRSEAAYSMKGTMNDLVSVGPNSKNCGAMG